jgi:hypothetical protein
VGASRRSGGRARRPAGGGRRAPSRTGSGAAQAERPGAPPSARPPTRGPRRRQPSRASRRTPSRPRGPRRDGTGRGARAPGRARRPRRPNLQASHRDDKFGTAFDALARATGIRIVRTAVRAPNMNAVCERFLGSLRRECLDHVLVLDSRHFQRVVAEYVRYHNAARPHQGIHQLTPVPAERPAEGNIVALPSARWLPSRLSKGRMRQPGAREFLAARSGGRRISSHHTRHAPGRPRDEDVGASSVPPGLRSFTSAPLLECDTSMCVVRARPAARVRRRHHGAPPSPADFGEFGAAPS